ncbi:MAG: 4-hydroxy-tetrahydrodipicolinate reductase [Clostridia bacterium]|nr:4-hydroxy-tetrahydrodipicolinate reductase [Clostridia bacterium]
MNILLNGASGNMGREVIQAINSDSELKIVCGVDREKTEIGFPIYNDVSDIKENIDVIIDFSVPVATLNILKYAVEKKIPIVIATTGFSKGELEIIEDYSKQIPIFKSSNMSLDINLMVQLVQKIAKVLSDSDIEITETHHRRKIDSPSGTAILLADAINEVLDNRKEYNFERMQKRERRNENEIGFSSIRGGNIVGEHTVAFFSDNEKLEIKHTAYSRQVFAQGALEAAKFLVKQEPGLYDMKSIV